MPPEPRLLDEKPMSADDWRKRDFYFRHLYSAKPDFQRLAKTDASFAALLKRNGRLDFSDPAAVMQLTKTLLKCDYDLDIELPDDRLCPPVPNRHNYILWLKDLMDSTSNENPGERLLGLDVGTGASCIYPLLGTAQRDWHFVGTDIDSKSLAYAQKNVELNKLQSKIRLLKREPSDDLIPLADLKADDSLDFIMMNPPFYTSDEEMVTAAENKSRPPNTACTGAPNEMISEGGEVAFVGRLLEESLRTRERVRWYTSMLGKASSLKMLVDKLREAKIDNYAVSELVQGNKTRRWTLGWSFLPMRPSEHAARSLRSAVWKKVLPPVVETELVSLEAKTNVGPLISKINETIECLDLLSWSWDKALSKGLGRASENVWSRAWRRKKQLEARDKASKPEEPSDLGETKLCRFGFAVSVRAESEKVSVILRWVEGHDQVLFESFGGYVLRPLRAFKKSNTFKS